MQDVEKEESLIDVNDRELLRKVSPVLAGKLASTALNVGIKLLIISFFMAEGSGVFAIHLSIVGVIGLLANLGFSNATLKLSASQFKDDIEVLRQDYVNMISVTLLVLLAIPVPILWVLAEPLATHFGGESTSALLFKISALTLIPHCMLEINVEVVRGIGKSYAYVLFKDVGIACVMLVSMFMMMQRESLDLLIPVKSHAIGVLVFSGLCFVMVFRSLYSKRGAKPKVGAGHSLKFLLELSLPMMLSKGLVFILPGIPILVLGFFVDSKDVGIYWMAYVFSLFVRSISYSMNVVVAPAIAYHYKQNEKQELVHVVQRSVKLTFWASMPLLIGMIVLSKNIMGIAGPEFEVGWSILSLFVLTHWFDMTCGPVGYLLIMTGKEKVFAQLTLICTLISVVLLLVLCPFFKGVGAAMAFLIFFVIWNLSSILFIRKHLGFNPLYLPGVPQKVV